MHGLPKSVCCAYDHSMYLDAHSIDFDYIFRKLSHHLGV